MTVEAIVVQETLEAAVDRIGALVEEAIFTFDDDGLQVRAVDPANVAMVDLRLEAAAFESYDGDDVRFGVDVDTLGDVLGLADSGALVQFAYDHETRKLDLNLGGIAYQYATIDPDSVRGEPDIPDLDLPAHPVISNVDLSNGVAAASVAQNGTSSSSMFRIGFDLDDHQAYAAAAGDTDEMRVEWTADELLDGSSADDDAESMLSLDYVSDVVSVLDDDPVSVDIGDEFPVGFAQSFADGRGHAQYMIAPRLEAE